ncbi:MAG: alpha-L-arabinofuranosidase C-terminal domain-containing protein, partial [Myxococcota bacterium]
MLRGPSGRPWVDALLTSCLLLACGSEEDGAPSGGGGSSGAGTGGTAGIAGAAGSAGSSGVAGSPGGSAGTAGSAGSMGPTSCADETLPCVHIGSQPTGTVVHPHLFGTQIEKLEDGEGLWDPAAMTPHQDMVSALQPLGTSVLRYPSGTMADHFHWAEAVGPVAGRTPQINPFVSTEDDIVTYIPVVGPDEAAELAAAVGWDLQLVANVGTGTPGELAAWLEHYKQNGTDVAYVEVGNEVYADGDGYIAALQRKSAAEYATLYDQYATVARTTYPNVRVGAIACHPYGAMDFCAEPNWNDLVLGGITEPIDFVASHAAYGLSMQLDDDVDRAFRGLLASPDHVADNLANLRATMTANGLGPEVPIAVTEYASFFLPGNPELEKMIEQLERNMSLGSALHAALLFNVFIAADVQLANQLHTVEEWWQAMLFTTESNTGPGVVQAFGHVVRLYAEASHGSVLPSSVERVPTYDAESFGFDAPRADVDTLDAMAVRSADGLRTFVYVVNRSLTDEVETRVIGPAAAQIFVDEVHNDDIMAFNTLAEPDNVS